MLVKQLLKSLWQTGLRTKTIWYNLYFTKYRVSFIFDFDTSSRDFITLNLFLRLGNVLVVDLLLAQISQTLLI